MKNKFHVVVKLDDGSEDSFYVHRTPREEVESVVKAYFGNRLVEILLIERIG